jgi:hypothetical protein
MAMGRGSRPSAYFGDAVRSTSRLSVESNDPTPSSFSSYWGVSLAITRVEYVKESLPLLTRYIRTSSGPGEPALSPNWGRNSNTRSSTPAPWRSTCRWVTGSSPCAAACLNTASSWSAVEGLVPRKDPTALATAKPTKAPMNAPKLCDSSHCPAANDARRKPPPWRLAPLRAPTRDMVAHYSSVTPSHPEPQSPSPIALPGTNAESRHRVGES